MTKYERRIQDLESLGMDTSDAQGVLDAELLSLSRYLASSLSKYLTQDQAETLLRNYYEQELDN